MLSSKNRAEVEMSLVKERFINTCKLHRFHFPCAATISTIALAQPAGPIPSTL